MAGSATFSHGGEGNQGEVSLSPDLDRMLRQRLVSIVHARHDAADDTVVVSIRIPFVGEKSILMHRVHAIRT